MQIGSNTLYDIGSNYTIKLNDKEMLVVEDDPAALSRAESHKKTTQKESQEKKLQDEKKKEDSKEELSPDEERLVRDLSSRDAEVKTHEAAHQAAGGGMTGAASYTYQQGPDGKMYAIGGEVSISVPTGSTPDETIANARQAMASAMAPGDPSSADFSVASSARAMEMRAQQEKNKTMQEELKADKGYKENSPDKEKTPPLESLDIFA